MFKLTLGLAVMLATGFVVPVEAQRQPPIAPPNVYVQLVIKACPQDPADMEPCAMAATASAGFPARMCAKAINQGKIYNDERSMSKEERNAYWAKIGCIDVPIPPEVMLGGDGATVKDLTLSECMGKRGYFSAMQYLEQNRTITQKAVGGWACLSQPYPASGVASF